MDGVREDDLKADSLKTEAKIFSKIEIETKIDDEWCLPKFPEVTISVTKLLNYFWVSLFG